MVIFPLAPDQTIAQMWSNGVRGGISNKLELILLYTVTHMMFVIYLF